jgi:hypothetical protein
VSVDQSEFAAILARAAEIVGQDEVAVRVRTDLLETVYIEVDDSGLIVHDGCRTFGYLVSPPGNTYVSWSTELAEFQARRFGVDFEDRSEEDSVSFRISLRPTGDVTIANAVRAVSESLDAIFNVHLREDLRRDL